LQIEVAITSDDGGATFRADYIGGATGIICLTETFELNNEIPSVTSVNTTDLTNILITCNGGKTFSAGLIRAVVYYDTFLDMANV